MYALLAALEGRAEGAARLLGWADEIRKARGQRQPNEVQARELALGALQGRLSNERLEPLMAIGASLDPAQVCELPLATRPSG